MKLYAKKVDLKEIVKKDINAAATIQMFTQYTKEKIEKLKYLINNIDNFNDYELFNNLSYFCNIIFEPKDYLRILARAYKVHYTDYINIKTMINQNGDIIEYFGATTKDNVRFNNVYLRLEEIRKLTNTNEFLILKTNYSRKEIKKEWGKACNHFCLNLDINNPTIDENSELFKYALDLFKKKIIKKDILYVLRIYYNELMYQVRSVTGLALSKDEALANLGKKYKDAYDKATNDSYIPKLKRIVVRHRKNSLK